MALSFQPVQGGPTEDSGTLLSVQFPVTVNNAFVMLRGFNLDTADGGEDHDVKQIRVSTADVTFRGNTVTFRYWCLMRDAANHRWTGTDILAEFLVIADV
jgi:hypothetical protein